MVEEQEDYYVVISVRNLINDVKRTVLNYVELTYYNPATS